MRTKIDVISGFLGAGKTTLIKKLLEESLRGEKIALIENEFGTVGIDGIIMKDYDIQIRELNAGCICCSIAGDFTQGLKEVLRPYKPDRVIIEPSGVSKLSDVLKGCLPFVDGEKVILNSCVTVLDVTKFKMYIKNFAQFYKDQITKARTIILSRTDAASKDKIDEIVFNIREINKEAVIITTPWERISGERLLAAMEEESRLSMETNLMKKETSKRKISSTPSLVGGTVNYKNRPQAEDSFQVWGIETSKIFDKAKIKSILQKFKDQDGFILRGKGIIEISNQKWIQFDYVPDEINMKETVPDVIGRICVIGEGINKEKLAQLFNINIS